MRRFALIFLLGLSALAALLLVRGMRYGDSVAHDLPPLPDAPAIDTAQAAEHLGAAIRFRTMSLAPGAQRDDQAWLDLHQWLQQTYPRVHESMQRELLGKLTLLYTWHGSDPTLAPLLLMAHQDVVPINDATLSDWTHPPFDGVVADGTIWGRGALDDKGSLVALMEAAEALLQSGYQPKRTVMLLFGDDEEIGGAGVQAAVTELQARGVRPEMVLDEGFMVLASFPITRRPAALIGIAEKGYLTLQLTARAAGGHSSMPPAESAAVRLARAIIALEEQQMPGSIRDQPAAGMMRALAPDLPFLLRTLLANPELFAPLVEARFSASPGGNATVRTTTAPTMLEGSVKDNVLPQAARAMVNFRLHPRDSADQVIAHVRELTGPFDIDVEIAPGTFASEASALSPTDTRGYRTLSALAAWVGNGAPVAPGLVLGATDARHLAPLTNAAYRFQPIIASSEELAGFHGTDERLSVANMGRMVEGYARFILAMSAD